MPGSAPGHDEVRARRGTRADRQFRSGRDCPRGDPRMQWLVIARDGTDPEAPERRARHRPAHLEGAARLQAAGHLLMGGAILDDSGRMIGSAAVAEFATRAGLDEWLRTDP